MNVPHPYDKDDLLADAYKRGWSHGHGIACHNVPTIGKAVWTDGLGKVTVDAENVREVHQDMCFSADDNSRQYSPFEFTAHWINTGGDDDTLSDDDREVYANDMWEAFDAGVSAAIAADLATYTDDDYGVIQEEVGDDY